MEEYHANQLVLQAKINNSFQNFKSKGKDKMTKGNAEAPLADLEKSYITFQLNHEKIMLLKALDKNHDYFTTNLSERVEDSFFDRKGEFLDFIENLREKNAAAGATTTPAAPPPSSAHPTHVSVSIIAKSKFAKVFW